MKTRALIATFALFTLVTLASAAGASEQTLVLDPKTTEISFTLPATGHDVHGVFVLRSAEIAFDTERGKAVGEVIVDAASAKTGSDSRDKTMHGKVLESAKFPLFVFTAERVEGALAATGESQLTLRGKLSFHGVDHDFALPTTVTRNADQVTAAVRFDVPFIAWGLTDPSIAFLKVGKTVAVTVAAHGRLAAATSSSGGGR